MPQANPAALAADLQLLRLKITGRALNTAGVTLLSFAIAILACVYQLTALERTGAGLVVAALMIVGGDLLSRRGGDRSWWFATSLMGAGYGLAYFFVHASHYIDGLSSFGSGFPSWIMALGLGAVATLHTSGNSLLRWAAIPFTLGISGLALFDALQSTDTVALAGLSFKVSAVASVAGMLWWSALSVIYKKLEVAENGENSKMTGAGVAYRIAHEGYFVLAAVNALALPKFCGSLQYAPLWWSLEMPILLAICWRSNSFLKHSLVMGIWGLSAVMLMVTDFDAMTVLLRMAVPVSGVTMALSYRYIRSSWAHWQKVIGYSVYLYGSAAVALLVPLLQLGMSEALPYWLLEAGVILSMALVLRDRMLQRVGSLAGLGALAVFTAHWQEWNYLTTGMIVAGCYALSITYGELKKRGGLANSDFVTLSGKYAISATEAGWLEKGAAGLGFLTMMGGSFLLFTNPYNTVAWGVEAFVLIAFGHLSGKVGHRVCGLMALAAAATKQVIMDLTMLGTLSAISFGAVGICFVAASMFYLLEFGQKKSGGEDSTPPPTDGTQDVPPGNDTGNAGQ